tara:strand:+ start:94 stop:270 length:177 start_codon:yes stop_codon:yes gene_type:complete
MKALATKYKLKINNVIDIIDNKKTEIIVFGLMRELISKNKFFINENNLGYLNLLFFFK